MSNVGAGVGGASGDSLPSRPPWLTFVDFPLRIAGPVFPRLLLQKKHEF